MKENRGITLVALVITVIIIIILSVVAISFAFGNNGLINRAEDARGMYANDTAYTEGSITNVESYINDVLIGEVEDNPDEPEGPTDPEDPEEPIEPVEPTIENILKEGDYVYYEDGTGTTRKCAVLYGPENENYDSYGIQIISMESVEELSLGQSGFVQEVEEFNYNKTLYNDIITTLNNATSKYLNTTYSSSVRCVGSVPNNPNYDESGMYSRTESWFTYNGQFKDADEYYLTDYNQMSKLEGVLDIGSDYWMASRYINSGEVYNDFNHFGVYMYENGYGLHYAYLCIVRSGIGAYANSDSMGLRPVFTLNTGLQITGGKGTSDEPYVLGL